MYKIKKIRNLKQLICFCTLCYVLFIGFFTWNFGVPETAYYATDFFLFFLFILNLDNILQIIRDKIIKGFTYSIITLVVLGTFSSILQSFHPTLWIWSIRNWGRLVLFFYLCCICLKKELLDRIIVFFVKLYDINTVVILIQYYFFRSRYGADQLNGLFGRTTSGINITVSLFVFCIVLSGYFSKKTSIKRLIVTVVEIAIVSAVAELRAVFFFLIVIFIVYVVLNVKLTAKQLLIYFALSVTGIITLIIASTYLTKIYPYFSGFFSIKRMIADASTEGGYGHTGYIDRLNAIPVINKYFFNGSGTMNKLLGIGMGNAEYSSVSFLTSSFYKRFGKTFRYLNFSSSMIYLEAGLCGLVFYSLSYLCLFFKYEKEIRKEKKKQLLESLYYDNIGMGAALISMIYIVYNNLQRTDAGIILALFLAVPIIIRKEKSYGKNNKSVACRTF